MHFDDTNDDLAIPKKEFKVIACLAVYGRGPLLTHTIKRLYEKNGCYKVICSGDLDADRKLCESLGAVWVHAKNKPLGAKWNKAFVRAKDFGPDAVVYMGSSDFISDNWFSVMEPYVRANDFVGVPGCHFVDVGDELRAVYWPGYASTKFHKDRATETIGIGRMLSAKLMHKIGWQPFNNEYDNSLDRSMKERCLKYGRVDDFMLKDDSLKAVSISTNKWVNKHKFEHHWGDALPSERINAEMFVNHNFPEIKMIFK